MYADPLPSGKFLLLLLSLTLSLTHTHTHTQHYRLQKYSSLNTYSHLLTSILQYSHKHTNAQPSHSHTCTPLHSHETTYMTYIGVAIDEWPNTRIKGSIIKTENGIERDRGRKREEEKRCELTPDRWSCYSDYCCHQKQLEGPIHKDY